MTTLNSKKAAFTRSLLLDAACELAQSMEISEISFKLVAEQAEISQRTMFRYFTTREEFLDALTARLYGELNLPDIPDSVAELQAYLVLLYQRLDAQPRKVMVLLSADLLPRVMRTTAKARFEDLQRLLADAYGTCAKSDIVKTAANIRYVMSASSWRYYRVNFDFDLQTSTECAQMVVNLSLQNLQKLGSE